MLATAAIDHVQPDWWLDWRGQCAAIVASGPSAKGVNHEILRGRTKVIAVNESYELCSFADVLYGCDRAFWKNQRGVPTFKGLKVAWEGDKYNRPPGFPDIRLVKVALARTPSEFKVNDRIILDPPGTLGCGGNSGFQAVNLAIQFGATKILLIGFDMHDRSGVHWFGRHHRQGQHNPTEDNFRRWRAAFDAVAPDLARRGIDVAYTSPNGALTCFRKKTIEQALAGWGL